MPGQNPIYFKDLVTPDGSIQKAIEELKELKATYSDVLSTVKQQASDIAQQINRASGATSEGRRAIEETSTAAKRLKSAQDELAFAISEVGKKVAWLKAQTSDANKTSVAQARYAQMISTSYNQLKTDLNSVVADYKRMTAEQRANTEAGRQALQTILGYKTQLKALDEAMRPHIQKLSEVEKAEKKLAFLRSEEGKRLMEIKAQIKEVTSANTQRAKSLSDVEKAQQKLDFAMSEENRRLQLYTTQISEANRVAKLTVQINNSVEGSYNRLSAQYSLNKIQLNKMGEADEKAAAAKRKLEEETRDLYMQMIKLQEATGNHTLSVGNYKKAWDGLGMSVNQIVREIPAAAISMNTFFLGISNNIPILIDEIQKLKRVNAELIAQGKPARSVIGQVVKSLFSFNTAIVLLLTVMAMYGEKIIDFFGSIVSGSKKLLTQTQIMRLYTDSLKNVSSEYGKNLATYKKLQKEWGNLKSLEEQNRWIKDNTGRFQELNISVTDTVTAEKAFVDSTESVVEALKMRARASAAMQAAEAKYAEAFTKREEATAMKDQKPSMLQSFLGLVTTDAGFMPGSLQKQTGLSGPELFKQGEIGRLEKEAEVAEDAANKLFELSNAYTEMAEASLKSVGLDSFSKPIKDGAKELVDWLNRLLKENAKIQAKYASSITDLETDEIKKRRKQTLDSYNKETSDLMLQYNERAKIIQQYETGTLDKRKKISAEEISQLRDAQETILKTITNYQLKISEDLRQIELDRQIQELSILKETTELRLQTVREGSQEELALRMKVLEVERRIALAQNSKLPVAQQQDPDLITSGFTRQMQTTAGDAALNTFAEAQAAEEALFNIKRRSSYQINRFSLQQERELIEEKLRLNKLGQNELSDEQLVQLRATKERIKRELDDLGDGATLLERLGFDDSQISALSEATSIVISQLQSIMQAEVDLAQAAVDAAEKRSEAAQSALDAEIEARNKGYASQVLTARKELEAAKKQELQKQKMLQEAQQRQQAIDSLMQASSLITASANIWSSLSKIPIVGPALAMAAIGTMWTSFAVAKVKAKQVTAQSEEYGEGGYEVLEGGSHASGNDIDLGVNNKRRKRMRAEGGEAIAIINKRSTRRYSKVIPDVIDSINKGIFEDKYVNAFSESDKLIVLQRDNTNVIDMSVTENELKAIRKQGETKYFPGPDGSIIEIKGNVKRIIRE